jgi:hypothetical protein
MNMQYGHKLHPLDQIAVLAHYQNRYTREHKPAWAQELRPNGEPYPVQFASDSEWLENTRFAVTKAGRLDKRARHCESAPTWPDGKPSAPVNKVIDAS